MKKVRRFDVYRVNLDPTVGSEIAKSRPCVVVSPDEMNLNLHTVLVAPATSTIKSWPTRVRSRIGGKDGEIALDQIRAIDKNRLAQRIGRIDDNTQAAVFSVLSAIFEP